MAEFAHGGKRVPATQVVVIPGPGTFSPRPVKGPIARGHKVNCGVSGREVAGHGTRSARKNIRHQSGAGQGTIALPQLIAVGGIGGIKKSARGELTEESDIAAAGARVNVFYHRRPSFGAVAPP